MWAIEGAPYLEKIVPKTTNKPFLLFYNYCQWIVKQTVSCVCATERDSAIHSTKSPWISIITIISQSGRLVDTNSSFFPVEFTPVAYPLICQSDLSG